MLHRRRCAPGALGRSGSRTQVQDSFHERSKFGERDSKFLGETGDSGADAAALHRSSSSRVLAYQPERSVVASAAKGRRTSNRRHAAGSGATPPTSNRRHAAYHAAAHTESYGPPTAAAALPTRPAVTPSISRPLQRSGDSSSAAPSAHGGATTAETTASRGRFMKHSEIPHARSLVPAHAALPPQNRSACRRAAAAGRCGPEMRTEMVTQP